MDYMKYVHRILGFSFNTVETVVDRIDSNERVNTAFDALYKNLCEKLEKESNGCITSLKNLELCEDYVDGVNAISIVIDVADWPMNKGLQDKQGNLDLLYEKGQLAPEEYIYDSEDLWGSPQLEIFVTSSLTNIGQEDLTLEEWSQVCNLFKGSCKTFYPLEYS